LLLCSKVDMRIPNRVGVFSVAPRRRRRSRDCSPLCWQSHVFAPHAAA